MPENIFCRLVNEVNDNIRRHRVEATTESCSSSRPGSRIFFSDGEFGIGEDGKVGLVYELVDYGFDEMNLQPSPHNECRGSRKLRQNVSTHSNPQSQSNSPNDIIGVIPIWPNGIHHVVPDIYNDKPDLISNLELSLGSFRLVLRPSGDGERGWSGTGTFWMRVEVLGDAFSGEAWCDRNLQ